MHLPADNLSPQYAFFKRAVEQIKKDGIDTVICLGDITSYGEWESFKEHFNLVQGMNYFYVLGNSDVRDEKTRDRFTNECKGFELYIGKRKIIGINTPFGNISQEDKKRIKLLSDGDILALHHGLHRIDEKSKEFLEKVANDKNLLIVHAHSHMKFDYECGRSRVVGLRALDPDKSIGDFPCVTYFDITDNNINLEEKIINISKEIVCDVSNYFGLSCVDNFKDVTYAAENNVKFIELRCNGADWYPDMSLLPVIDGWRKKTGGYLSVHMPNIYWRDGELKGEENWYKAVDYAVKVKADGLTIHPPRVKKDDMEINGDVWKMFLKLYTYVAENVDENVKIGIENLHMERGENEETRAFGYNPQEVSLWIDSINGSLGKTNRVGHLLDVGHARNNGSVSQKFPISQWYRIMGNKTVAYHIHQVVPTENGLGNHRPIENWFGPVISYASFFYAWGEKILNHVPVFLEVKGSGNFEKSIKAFTDMLDGMPDD